MPNSASRNRLTYREARARLYSLEHWGIKLGLDNIREFCALLGNPQEQFLSIHIAGTNGKGSTSAFLDSILRSAGYRVGRYTSPHLRDFCERIHIGGAPVPKSWVTDFVSRYWDTIIERRFSYFEVTTALGFAAFARAKVDLAVVEVGLGGRFDATNIIDPVASVITRIARDHEHVLGHTAREIAFEKAGIIKTGTPVVIGPMVAEAEARIREIAEERSAPVWTSSELLAGLEPDYELRTPLSGAHQVSNLAIAVAAARLIGAQGIPISPQSIRRGVSAARWPARFQIAAGKPTIVYDAGHNPDGAHAIVATWRREFGTRRGIGTFNARPDKNHAEIVAILSEIVSRWIFCPMPDSPYIERDTLMRLAAQHGQPAQWENSPAEAMGAACRLADTHDIILVTGSHYLVGAVIPARLMSSRSGPQKLHSVSRSQLLAAAKDRGADF